MSNSSSRVRFEIFIAVLLVLGLYSIAQGDGLSSVVGQPHAREAPAQEPAAQQAPAQQMGVPSGAVMFFNLSTCPNGWTELSAARGRYIVGLLDSGELGATVGYALEEKENRPVGAHTHVVPPHSHTVTDRGHTHSGFTSSNPIDITAEDTGHSHGFQMYAGGGDGYYPDATDSDKDPRGGSTRAGYAQIELDQEPHFHSLDVNTGYANVSVDPADIAVEWEGGVNGTNAPYIQLLACQRN